MLLWRSHSPIHPYLARATHFVHLDGVAGECHGSNSTTNVTTFTNAMVRWMVTFQSTIKVRRRFHAHSLLLHECTFRCHPFTRVHIMCSSIGRGSLRSHTDVAFQHSSNGHQRCTLIPVITVTFDRYLSTTVTESFWTSVSFCGLCRPRCCAAPHNH